MPLSAKLMQLASFDMSKVRLGLKHKCVCVCMCVCLCVCVNVRA